MKCQECHICDLCSKTTESAIMPLVMVKTFEESVKFLESFIPSPEKKHPGKLGLERMEYLVELLGNPHLTYPTIHVGGTSGKGSTATIIASILATKYKVGLHTSPHLERITERIKIVKKWKVARHLGGVMASQVQPATLEVEEFEASEKEFLELVDEIRPVVEKVEESGFGKPSYFEIVAALAFLYFAKKKVDIAVIEVGMGGRWDATNVVKPSVAVLTNVGLDHTEVLGETVEEIAKDKAGIIKSGIQVVSGVSQPSVIEIIEDACRKNNASLFLLISSPRRSASHTIRGDLNAFNYRITKLTSEGCLFDYFGDNTYRNLKLSLLGEHQVENASLAIRAVEVINMQICKYANKPINRKIPNSITENKIRYVLKHVFVPGRLEIVKKDPLVILDGAHNQDKTKVLAKAIKAIFPEKKVFLVLAIKKGKDAKGMISRLVSISDKIILTKFRLTTDLGDTFSYDPEDLHKIVKRINKKIKVKIVNDSSRAVKEAMRNDLILVTGSLYLVGEVRKSYHQYSGPFFPRIR